MFTPQIRLRIKKLAVNTAIARLAVKVNGLVAQLVRAHA